MAHTDKRAPGHDPGDGPGADAHLNRGEQPAMVADVASEQTGPIGPEGVDTVEDLLSSSPPDVPDGTSPAGEDPAQCVDDELTATASEAARDDDAADFDENSANGDDAVDGQAFDVKATSDESDDSDDSPQALARADVQRFHMPDAEPAEEPATTPDVDRRKPMTYAPGNLVRDVAEVEQVLLESGLPIFVHGQRLGIVGTAGADSAASAMQIHELTQQHLTAVLSTLIRFDQKKGQQLVSVDAPTMLVKAILHGPTWPFPPLRRLVDIPTMLPDGSIIDKPGYHAESGVFLSEDVTLVVPPIPDAPTLEDAQAALALLHDLVVDCLFAEPCHRAAALSGIMTPLVRSAIDGPVPMFVVQAAMSRIGKSELVQFVSLLATGKPAKVQPPRNDVEMEKRLTGHVKAGDKLVAFDNGTAPLGGPALEAALTSRVWVGRILGSNQLYSGPMELVIFFTGNHVTYHLDMLGRVVVVRLETEMENLGDRQLQRPDAQAWALQNRGRLIAAVLTVCRGYIAAGSPDMGLPALPGFASWSRIVRSALVWAGEVDPLAEIKQLKAEADPETEALAVALEALEALFPDGMNFTAKMVYDLLKGPPPADASRWNIEPLGEALQSFWVRTRSASVRCVWATPSRS